jgi:outer membrane protein OmpA-like peptidoglycan-associated protein
MKYWKPVVCAFLVSTLVACAADDPNRSAKTGAAVGAVLGAIAGNQSKSNKGKYVGAVVGAIAGGAVGHYMDKQRQELERKLKAERDAQELSISQLGQDALKIGVASDASFDVGNAQLKSDALNTFAKIASVLKDYDKTVIHVVGHTDSTGSDSLNQTLSQNRAASVASYLAQQGVPASRIREEGRSKREPVADNSTADGRKRNRRVDIVIKPVIEGQEDQAWSPPPYLGS